MTQIYRYDELDLSKIEFEVPEKQGNIYYSQVKCDNNPFYLQTSKLNILSDVNELSGVNPSMEFEVPDNNLDIHDLFHELDDMLVKTTYKNSVEWFKQKIPLEVIDDMYKRICKPLKRNQNPTLKFKLPVIQNKVVCKIYNQDRKFINVEDIKKDSTGILILHIRGIKFLKQQYLYDIYITQMKVFIPKTNKYLIPDECLIDGDFCTQSDEEIVDDVAIKKIKKNKEQMILRKKEDINKIKMLQDEINKMNRNLENIE